MGGGPAPIPQNIDPQTAEALKQAQQAQAQQAAQQQAQQEAVPTFSAYAQPQAAAPAQEGSKGIGSIDGTITKNQKKGNKGWIAIVAAVIVVVVVAVVLLGGKEEQETEAQATTNTTTVVTKTNKAAAPKTTTATSQEVSAQKVAAAPTTNKTATAAKPKPKEPTLAEMTPAQAYTKGMQLFDKGNYDQAIAHLEKAANANHADAAYQLGEMYLSGVGVDANKETAIRWYKVAAKAGHKQAKRKLF
jgi:tetratricopeptide (TPR) repeat protein